MLNFECREVQLTVMQTKDGHPSGVLKKSNDL